MSPAYEEFLSDLLSRKDFDAQSFEREIGAGDEMFYKAVLLGSPENPGLALFKYFESALRSFDIYKQIADHLGGFPNLGPVLDFGSGWGRLTRCIVQKMAREKIWVSDIYSEAIAWQAETFGVNGLCSVSDPDRFALQHEYSIVFVGSVFSHLPHDLFQRWLQKLYGLVAPNGVLAFSVADETWLQMGEFPAENVGSDGTMFFPKSESASLGPEIYGAMYVNEDYVRRSAAALDPGREVEMRRYRAALYENQDLYVIAGEEANLTELDLTITPLGGTDYISLSDEGAALGGWAIDLNPGHQLVRTELFVAGHSLGRLQTATGHDVAMKYFPAASNIAVRWSCDFLRPATDAMVRIESESSSGAVIQTYAWVSARNVQGPILPRT